jgi:membrane-associated protein
MEEFFNSLGDLKTFIEYIGLVGVYAIIFAETGLLIGFFLPGDSMLFTAGFLASQGLFDIAALAIGAFIAAVVGDTVGYWFGHRVGRKLFEREDSRFFKKKHLYRAEELYEKHGGKIIILARFMPFVRTFAPIVAGIGAMHYRNFISFNVVGGFLWAVGVTVAGYFLGSLIPDVDRYLLPIIALIILVSVAPPAWHVFKDWWAERQARKQATPSVSESDTTA